MNLIDNDTLLKMAEAEILKESKKAAIRYSVAGISGWQPCPKPNKVFLTNTLLQTMASNRLFSKKHTEKKNHASKFRKNERKLLQKKQKNERTNFIFQKPKKNEQRSVNNNEKLNKSLKDKIILETVKHKKVLKTNNKCQNKK